MNDASTSTTTFSGSLQAMFAGFMGALPELILGIVVFVLFYFLARVLKAFVKRSIKREGLSEAIGRISQVAVVVVGLLIAMTIIFPSVNLGGVLGSLGIGGVAIGFAFQDVLQNYFAGLLLLWSEPFRVGDQIETSNGYIGTVMSIETRSTTLKTYDGRRVVIPNSNLFTDDVVVNTAREYRRSEYDVGIGYGDDIETAREVILEAVKGVEAVVREPEPDVVLVDLAGSSVNLRARWWTEPDQASVVTVRDKVLTAVKYALNDAGIDMPYPTEVHLFHDQTEAIDGDRAEQREGWPPVETNPQARWKAQAEARQVAEAAS